MLPIFILSVLSWIIETKVHIRCIDFLVVVRIFFYFIYKLISNELSMAISATNSVLCLVILGLFLNNEKEARLTFSSINHVHEFTWFKVICLLCFKILLFKTKDLFPCTLYHFESFWHVLNGMLIKLLLKSPLHILCHQLWVNEILRWLLWKVLKYWFRVSIIHVISFVYPYIDFLFSIKKRHNDFANEILISHFRSIFKILS